MYILHIFVLDLHLAYIWHNLFILVPVFCRQWEKLSRVIPTSQLPLNYGGHMLYVHDKWIKFRTVSITNF